MQITITTLTDNPFSIEVGEDLELENFKALCEVETGIKPAVMAIIWNGRQLQDHKKTLKEYGITNGDIVLIQHTRSVNRQPQQPGASRTSISSGMLGFPSSFDFTFTLHILSIQSQSI